MQLQQLLRTIGVALVAKGMWRIAGLMFLGKMLWWMYWGTLLEVDSVGYLQMQMALYHPPGYVVFCGAIVAVFKYVEAIVIVQSLLLSVSVGLLLSRYIRLPRWQWIAGLVLALEPCTGLMCANIMAEALFLSILMVAFCCLRPLLQKEGRLALTASGLLGLLMGLAYLTRYAAPVLMAALVLTMLLIRMNWRRMLPAVAIMLIAFQLALLPMRLYYWAKFDTTRFNAFTELSIWNSAAYLFPGSDRATHPKTEFETYLGQAPDSVFEMKHTWYTNHFFNGEWPYQLFTASQTTAEALATARKAGNTGLHLILQAPGRHLREFILPNLARPFTTPHTIYSDRLPPLIAFPVGFQKTLKFDYQPIVWWFGFGLLLTATGIQLRYRKQLPPATLYLILGCWLYLAAVSLLAVVFLRFVYMLVPLILIALLLQGNVLWQPRPIASKTS
jgi:4-amino-4-deoxy-L-arabinose transferase-like glycosyltransferase